MENLAQHLIDPWTLHASSSLWILVMGFFVSASCGLIGCFLILRRMALIGDAISHSILPGIAIAFLLAGSRASLPMLLGAMVAGLFTILAIEWIHKKSPIKVDAAIGIVFSTLFAIGVIIISVYADHIDLDLDCVLYGEIAFVPLEPALTALGCTLGPESVVRMGAVFLIGIILLRLFYKELLVATFDPGLARTLGLKPNLIHYLLTIFLALIVVSAFEAVGAILVIAMLLFPGATAMLLHKDMPSILRTTLLLSIVYPILGLELANLMDCSIAGMMSSVAFLIFLISWFFYSKRKTS